MAETHSICCLNGDGISTELIDASVAVLNALQPVYVKPVALSHYEVGFSSLKAHGTTLTDEVITAASEASGIILGPVSHAEYPLPEQGGLNPSGVLRKTLSLFANIRPARCYPGLSHYTEKPFDILIMRENLEGFYADRNMLAGGGEFMPAEGVALAVRKITTAASSDIARAAFEQARRRKMKKVTSVHKANVMRLTDGVFLDAVREVAAQFPDIEYNEVLVDAAAAMLVRCPQDFDVIVTTNMFGDILSDLASELAGSLGLAGSLNRGSTAAMAQAQHGSAPDIAGRDLANPVSMLLSVAMLLEHLEETEAAARLETQISQMLSSPASRTADLGGQLSCSEFTAQLISRLNTG